MRLSILVISAGLVATPATAEVVSSGPNAFHIRHKVNLVVKPDRAFELIGQPQLWWNPEHTYSEDSANLRIDLRPGGQFLERVPKTGGSVEHMRVVHVTPGEQVVMTGGLGPLVFQAASGTMVWSVEEAGAASVMTLDYKVTGFANGDGEKWAQAVDGVLGEQLSRLRRRAAVGDRRDIP